MDLFGGNDNLVRKTRKLKNKLKTEQQQQQSWNKYPKSRNKSRLVLTSCKWDLVVHLGVGHQSVTTLNQGRAWGRESPRRPGPVPEEDRLPLEKGASV